jgi:hypothetical protein
MSKKHMTALGKPFDMAALRAKNELTRAVGNMNVNARGDTLDSNNHIIQDSTKRVNEMYKKTIQTATKANATNPSTVIVPKIDPAEVSQHELNDFDDDTPNPDKPGAKK